MGMFVYFNYIKVSYYELPLLRQKRIHPCFLMDWLNPDATCCLQRRIRRHARGKKQYKMRAQTVGITEDHELLPKSFACRTWFTLIAKMTVWNTQFDNLSFQEQLVSPHNPHSTVASPHNPHSTVASQHNPHSTVSRLAKPPRTRLVRRWYNGRNPCHQVP
jgi:hypothetical protein